MSVEANDRSINLSVKTKISVVMKFNLKSQAESEIGAGIDSDGIGRLLDVWTSCIEM
jgi:UDP-N-acetylglucosamine pyrophosphorylase